MRTYELHRYSGMEYGAEQMITFSKNLAPPDIDEEMKYHTGVRSVQVSNLTQAEFDYFIEKYGEMYESIYFFHNTKVTNLSALSRLKKVKYLLFYHMRAKALWDMRENLSLKGIMISDSKGMLYDLEQLQYAPNLEELLLFSSVFNKYPVKTIEPLKKCKALHRLYMEFNTEDNSFRPEDFVHLDLFEYQCDRKRNFTY